MAPLTLHEVIKKINDIYLLSNPRPSNQGQVENLRHRPEFYVPRIALRIAALKFSGLKLWGLTGLVK
jgi:hypothetical protein